MSLGCESVEPGSALQCALTAGDSPTRGPDDAWVTVVEFADFQCIYCKAVLPTLEAVDAERPDEVRWVFKHFPLAMHSRARPAAVAAECAHQQDEFWQMHAALFAHQSALGEDDLAAYTEEIGLDVTAWQDCRNSDLPDRRLEADQADALRAGVSATPAFFVNGQPLLGARPLGDFLEAIDRARDSARAGQASGKDPAEYYAELTREPCQ